MGAEPDVNNWRSRLKWGIVALFHYFQKLISGNTVHVILLVCRVDRPYVDCGSRSETENQGMRIGSTLPLH
ncbi:hypothetical protein VTK56DRAFT_6849 [Thermocarpiscus australiensis]